MTLALLAALLVAAQEPGPPEIPEPEPFLLGPQDPEARSALRFDRLEPEVLEKEIVLRVFGLRIEEAERELRADLAILRFDRARWEEARAEEAIRPGRRPRPPAEPERLLGGAWSRTLLSWAPGGEELLEEVLLDGRVYLRSPQIRLSCDRFRHRVQEGWTEVWNVDFELGYGQGPRGWPFRIRSGRLREEADRSLHARNVALTTCNEAPPHYELRIGELHGRPLPDGEWRWSPSAGRLEIGGVELLPVPTPDFETGESFFGLRRLELNSNRALGTALVPEFGGSGEVLGASLDWSLFPTLSSRRGLPVDLRMDLASGIWTGNWRLFGLQDRASDVHRLADRVGRADDTRWRLRLDNRFELGDGWRLDLDAALTSDPLVDPEFFNEDWIHQDDARTEAYLRHAGAGSFFDVWAYGRLDQPGFTPLEGFPAPGSAAPQQLDALPRLRYAWYSTTLLDLPARWIAGDDELVPVNFSWSVELARLELRDREIVAAPGLPPFASQPTLLRDRAILDAELALPLHAGPLFVRPGARFQGFAYDEDLLGAGGASRALTEGFVEIGTLLFKDWEHGWQHRVLPQVRLRSRGASGDDPAGLPLLDERDLARSGQAVELSLRQFFYAPGSDASWLDVDLLFPWYPDPAEPLQDPLFPYPHSFESSERWGPAELRMTWTPGTYGETLEGLRVDTRLRQNLHEGNLVEFFGRLAVRPHERLEYGVALQKVDGLFSQAQAFIDWRLADEWGLRLVQPHNFTGGASKRSQLALRHYSHDLVLEVGVERDQSQGQTGFFFNLQPRFLVEDAPPAPPRQP